MDKYEFKIKAEQIQKLIERKDYRMAAKIADGIDWRRVKNVELLMQVSEAYERLKRYEDSYELLNMAYDRAPIGRMIVYKMTELAIRMGELDEATELYKEFVKIDPHNLSRYILKYKLYQAKNAPAEDLIAVLEEFKSREYHEKWAYELAVLYYQEGMKDKCVEECDDLILWFSEGEYVRKAIELKMQLQPLSASQEQKYRELAPEDYYDSRRFWEAQEQADGEEPDEEYSGADGELDIEIRTVDPEERYNTVNLQAEVAAGLRDLFEEEAQANQAYEGDGYEEYSYEEYGSDGVYGDEGFYEEDGYENYGDGVYEEDGTYEEYGYVEDYYAEDGYESSAYSEEDDTEDGYGADEYADEEYDGQDYDGDGYSEASGDEADAGSTSGTAEAKDTVVDEPDRGRKLYLGQAEDGQLTFDDQENVLDRQITGQIKIEDILAEWEAKKQQMSAELNRITIKEQERKEEDLRRRLEAADFDSGLIPPDVQRLLDEIEGKLPVKIIVKPIERSQPGFLQEEEAQEELFSEQEVFEEYPEYEDQEYGEYEEYEDYDQEPEDTAWDYFDEDYEEDTWMDSQDTEGYSADTEGENEYYSGADSYLEEDGEEFYEDYEESEKYWEETEETREEASEEPQEDEIEEILRAALQEEMEANGDLFAQEKYAEEPEIQEEPKEEAAEKTEKTDSEKKNTEKDAEEESGKEPSEKKHASDMMWDLEKVLEDELKQVSGKRLSEEQEKLFAYFTSVHGMNRQLSQFLEDEENRQLDGTSVTGNIVVTGEGGSGKTTLAVDLVKAIQKLRGAKGSKMARVTGESMNQRDVPAVVRKLNGGALVIEHAGGMSAEAAAKLSGAMLGQTGNLFVVLEDEPAELKKLFTRCESLAAKFDRTIEIPVFTNHELVAFGKSYGQEQGYALDEMAVLALYNRIGNNQTSDHLVNVAEVKDMIDDAIISSSRRGIKRLFSKRKQDEFGNYVLMEKDFEL